MSPLLLLGYQQSLLLFDVIQFALLPLTAVMLLLLLEGRGRVLTIAVFAVVLFQPSPAPAGLSLSFFWQWGEGQAKVFQTFLLVSSFYLGKSGRPRMSGVSLGLAAFDPRFALLAVPLFLTLNRGGRMLTAAGYALVTFLASNLVLLYPGLGSGFLSTLNSGAITPLYPYAVIPLVAVLALTLVESRAVASTVRQVAVNLRDSYLLAEM